MKVIGIWIGFIGIVMIVGLVFGGVFVDFVFWCDVFVINVFLIVVMFVFLV